MLQSLAVLLLLLLLTFFSTKRPLRRLVVIEICVHVGSRVEDAQQMCVTLFKF